MKIHHLNGLSFCPHGGFLLHNKGIFHGDVTFVTHCLLLETEQGLVLVDTAFGEQDVLLHKQRIPGFFDLLLRPQYSLEMTLKRQIEKLGFKASDVRHILLTHLDLDHAGGLGDFPQAKVHVLRAECNAAYEAADMKSQYRYIPAQWAHGVKWELYDAGGEPWFGFSSVRDLRGLPPEILLIPTIGHTAGHCAIAIDTGSGWLLHAGDAYFHQHEVHGKTAFCPPGLELFQSAIAWDNERRKTNRDRLRELAQNHYHEVRVFCSHDPDELAAFA